MQEIAGSSTNEVPFNAAIRACERASRWKEAMSTWSALEVPFRAARERARECWLFWLLHVMVMGVEEEKAELPPRRRSFIFFSGCGCECKEVL